MVSRLRVGDGIEYLREKAGRGNKSAQAELAKIVTPENLLFWDAFMMLNNSRQSGMGNSPLQISEINAVADLLQVCTSQRLRLTRALQAMDGALMNWNANGNA